MLHKQTKNIAVIINNNHLFIVQQLTNFAKPHKSVCVCLCMCVYMNVFDINILFVCECVCVCVCLAPL